MIFHIDVNSAFLSWSAVKALEEDPNALDLRTVPSAVGGDIKTRHGIITARSIPAKQYGIKTGEPVVKALQKCPELILVRGDFATYRRYSHAFMEILRKYAAVVEPASIDEAFLDMTGTEGLFAEEIAAGDPFPVCAARVIKDEIRDTLGFTVNVGISCNKLLAKMASDFRKPDRIHTLYPQEVPEKMWPLPVGDLYGCGAKTAARLNDLGIRTIGEAAKADLVMLRRILGEKGGEYIHAAANGYGSDVVSDEQEAAKSYSNEITTSEDVTALNYQTLGIELLHRLAESVSRRLQRDNVRAYTIVVTVKTAGFHRHTRQTTLRDATNREEVIFQTADRLMRGLLFGEESMHPTREKGRKQTPENGGVQIRENAGLQAQEDGGLLAREDGIRLIGVGAGKMEDSPFEQMDLFQWLEEAEKQKESAQNEEKTRKLQEMLDNANGRYGNGALTKGFRTEHE